MGNSDDDDLGGWRGDGKAITTVIAWTTGTTRVRAMARVTARATAATTAGGTGDGADVGDGHGHGAG
eukprot:6130804-Pleurochrysis_carterae.AAC.1